MNKFKYGIIGFIIGSTCISTVAYGASKILNVETISLKYLIDGIEKKLPDGQEGFTYNGRTYVTLRFISEALGNEVVWDGNSSTIYIDKKQSESNQVDGFKKGSQIVENGDWVYIIDYNNEHQLYKMKLTALAR